MHIRLSLGLAILNCWVDAALNTVVDSDNVQAAGARIYKP